MSSSREHRSRFPWKDPASMMRPCCITTTGSAQHRVSGELGLAARAVFIEPLHLNAHTIMRLAW
ncbi:MAG: hypothetical protein KJ630_08875 [Proteobacteria bacterium]|nr:hypothetical protein [Pseudomonadota bacterium]